jgi:hypothetical protein
MDGWAGEMRDDINWEQGVGTCLCFPSQTREWYSNCSKSKFVSREEEGMLSLSDGNPGGRWGEEDNDREGKIMESLKREDGTKEEAEDDESEG